MTPDWEAGRNILNYFYRVESSCSDYIQVHELIQRLAAPAAETAQCYTTTAGTKALLATSLCLNNGHRCPSPGNLTQPLCSLPRAQLPSRHLLVPTFPREKRQQNILISLLTDLTRIFSKSLLTTVTSLTRRWFCFMSTYYSFSKSKMELHTSISAISVQRKSVDALPCTSGLSKCLPSTAPAALPNPCSDVLPSRTIIYTPQPKHTFLSLVGSQLRRVSV